MSLLAELRRRNVFRVAATYLVVGWLLTEVLTTILPTLGAPRSPLGKAGEGYRVSSQFISTVMASMSADGRERLARKRVISSMTGQL